MLELLKSIDLISLVLGTVIGTLASTWYGYYVKRPKLIIGGTGGGGSSDLRHIEIHLMNVPGLIGLRIRESTIFGWHLNRDREVGLVVDRTPAYQCRAFLRDKESGEGICQLWWRGPDHNITDVVNLNSGEQAVLMLFASRLGQQPIYFPYQVGGADALHPIIPEKRLQFDSARDFSIDVSYSHGRRAKRIGCKVTRGYDGTFRFAMQGGGSGVL